MITGSLHEEKLSYPGLSCDQLRQKVDQHHFAHALSCMAEYGSVGPALAILMDGTGYGEDGTVWGGEFLEVTVSRYRRLGHLRYIPLPGGDRAVREPWRMGAAYLERIYGYFEGSQIPFSKESTPRGRGFDLPPERAL